MLLSDKKLKIMKLYISSIGFGSESEFLISYAKNVGKRLGLIWNAFDIVGGEATEKTSEFSTQLSEFGFEVEVLDLRNYYENQDALRQKCSELDGVWVCDGSTFRLRQSMSQSGFDDILVEELVNREDFLYASEGAGSKVLGADLGYLKDLESNGDFSFETLDEVHSDGLNIIDFSIITGYDSEFLKSEVNSKAVKHCLDNKILFLALSDGEVILEK